MKKFFQFCLSAFFLSNLCALDYQELLQSTQDKTAFYETDFSANYTVVQEKPGEGSNLSQAILYRRDKGAKWTILITGPAKEKGKGYLKTDETIWFYDPADRRFTFTSAKDSFQNTNARTSDFAPQKYADEYSIESANEVKLGKLSCILFELKAKVQNLDYPILKLWVTKDDGLVRKKEDYSLSGQKLRTTVIPSYQTVKSQSGKSYSVPVNMLIRDELKSKKIDGKTHYEQTQITITNPSFKKLDDSTYTKPYLEMMSSK